MISRDIREWIVLIVDDEEDNLRVAEKIFSYDGAKVYTARNGLEGLVVLEQVKPTFILLDLSMPEMDGWQMFEQIRANQNLHDVPVIALTAHAMAGDKERVIERGFDGYIAKPFRISSLLGHIQMHRH